MANIYSEQYVYKYGRLVQYGTNYMQGFSTFADDFYNQYDSHKNELNEYGYSPEWVQWQKQNCNYIIQLHDDLDAQNLIPTTPE